LKFDELTIQKPPRGPRRLVDSVVFHLTMSEWETRKRKKFAAKDGPRINKGPPNGKKYNENSDDDKEEEDTHPSRPQSPHEPEDKMEEGQEEGPTNKYGDGCVEKSESEESEKDIVVIPDEPLTEIGTPVKLGSIARLPILEHWALEGGKNAENATYLEYKGKFVWCCNHCQVKRTADISESTGNLWQHSNKHGFFSTRSNTHTPTGQSKLPVELLGKKLNARIVDMANYKLMKVLVGDMRTLNLGFSDNFKEFVQVLSPMYEIPQQEGTRNLLESYLKDTCQPSVKKELANVKRMAGTTDGWKSPSKIAMQTLEVHYVTKEGHPRHRIIDISEIDAESIDHLVLKKYFEQVFAKYGIELDRITLFVVDGGSNQWKALEELGVLVIWCGCHAIAVCVKAGLGAPESLEAFMKPKTLVTWFNTSMPHMKTLRDLQKKTNKRIKLSDQEYREHVYVLVQENDTRWNSWYLCIDRIILLWPEIKETLAQYNVQHLMGESDIALYKEFVLLLQPLYHSTLELEKENSTLSDILCEIVGLIDHLRNWNKDSQYNNSDRVAQLILDKMERTYNEYVEKEIMIAAVFLDKRFGDNWKQIIHSESDQKSGKEWIEKELTTLNPNWKASGNLQSTTGSGGFSTIGSKFKKFTDVVQTDELNKYQSLPQPQQGVHILDWWMDSVQRQAMPTLSILAINIFSIPGSAAISERTWSTVGRIWSPVRNRLQPETVSMLTYLKSNFDMW
jgi:hypothetical protein